MRSFKPTHGTPLNEEERKVARNTGGKGWQAGARYNYTSHFGSAASNNKPKNLLRVKGRAGAKPTSAVVRPIVRPPWARKYAHDDVT